MLTLFTRIDRLLKANLNHMLDQVEDPGRMLAQLIRDLDAGMCEARTQVAGAMAAEKRLAARLRDHQARRDDWAARAEAEAELMDQPDTQEQSFRDLETATQVDRELAALKARRAARD